MDHNLNKSTYLDYNSTTPIEPRVLEAMLPFLKEYFANPSSTHYYGNEVNKKVKQAREQIADFLNAEPNELIFTSGATEAINIAIKGIFESHSNKGNHIITVSTEHKAVLDTCKFLEGKGIEVSYLPVGRSGLIDLEKLKENIKPSTGLITVMYVNNETGIIHSIKEIAAIAHEKEVLFMTDATQAVGKIGTDVENLGVDMFCFSGHKMYAPKGVGALYIRKRGDRIKLVPQMHGGGHEHGLRSGTLNVPGIIAMAKASEIAKQEMLESQNSIAKLRDYLERELLQLPNTFINGDIKNRIYNTSNICFRGQDANILMGRMKNIAVSNGSACSSAVIAPSHVLRAMGLSDEDAFASLRFSLGKYNTVEDIKTVIRQIKSILK